MLDQFHLKCHPYIFDVIDLKIDSHYGYQFVVALLGMGRDSWPFVRMDLFKEVFQWRDEHATVFGD